jgi:hypothetical protein
MIRTLLWLLLAFIVSGQSALEAQVRVRGYYRRDGTYVRPHVRSSPNSTTLDNYSTRGNVNPYTGAAGTRDPYVKPRPPEPWRAPTDSGSHVPAWTPARAAAAGDAGVFFLHGNMNVRSGPGTYFPVLRTERRGGVLELGARRTDGWAQVSGGGWIYRASPLVRTSPPSTRATRPARRHPAGASAICSDGSYSYSRSRRGTCSWHGGVRRWL